jgi:hypothetical protein
MRAWLTPNRGPGAALCRPLIVPIEYQHIVSGCLEQLAETWNWEQLGDIDVDTAVADMRAALDAYYAGECDMGTPAPGRDFHLWWEGKVITGNALTAFFDSAQSLGVYWGQTNSAQNDKMEFQTVIADGTYSLKMKVRKSANKAIAHILIDDTEVGTVDMYSATAISDAEVSTSIVVEIGGAHILSFLMSTKNASSTGYGALVTMFTLLRTGD